jgi:PAS domain S-box-containing protein
VTVPGSERDTELEELRRRLADAEETLQAIYHGAIDALVVRGPDGPQIFTLRGAQEPYRVLVEHMNEGALTCAPDGTILYSNRHFADLLGAPLETIVGKPLARFVSEQDQGALQALMADGTRRSLRRELVLVRSDGSEMPALTAVGPLVIDDVSAVLLIVTDLTAQKHSEQIAAAERFARSILEQAADAVLVFDPQGRISQASWAAERLLDRDLIGQNVADVLPLDLGETAPAAATSMRSLQDMVLGGESCHGIEARIRRPGLRDRHFLLSAGPLRDADNRHIGGIFTLTDITERKEAEEHQTMLVAELNHRVKNILAIVQSVALQTLSGSKTLPQFRDAFGGRLKAIALAHDILTLTRWGEVELSRLLQQSLAPYQTADGRAVSCSGPPLMLPSHMIVSLAMVLHELSTNAAKYGAFAAPTGRLSVRWQLTEGGRGVHLTWTETGGPAASADVSPGFGSKLISRVVSYDLKGRAELQMHAEGVCWTLSFPVPRGDAKDAPQVVTAAE